MSDFSILSKIRKILKKPPLRKKNSYGHNCAPKQEVRVFIISLYIKFWLKTPLAFKGPFSAHTNFFYDEFIDFWKTSFFRNFHFCNILRGVIVGFHLVTSCIPSSSWWTYQVIIIKILLKMELKWARYVHNSF